MEPFIKKTRFQAMALQFLQNLTKNENSVKSPILFPKY